MQALWGWVPGLKQDETPDYLADERIHLVNFGQLKTFLKQNGVKPNDMQYASTKYALIAYAEKFKVKLEPLLDQVDRATFPGKYKDAPAPAQPPTRGGTPRVSASQAAAAPTGGAQEAAAAAPVEAAAPVAVPKSAAPPAPPPTALTITQKVEKIKEKLGIPPEVDFSAERMAATVPIEGTVDEKITALYTKLCVTQITEADVDHLKSSATTIQSRFRGNQARSHGKGQLVASKQAANVPTLQSLTSDQLRALVQAIIDREEVLESGEG